MKLKTGKRALLRERYINIEMRKKQEERISKLYASYSKGVRSMAPDASPVSREEFTYQLFSRKQGMSGERFATRLAAKTANVPTRFEAMLTKKEAAALGMDVSGITLNDLRKDKGLMGRLQHEIYEEKKKSGLSIEELQDWWTENIVGSD